MADLISDLLEFERNIYWRTGRVLLRGVPVRFMAVLLRDVVRVVTAQSEHLFYKRANVPEAINVGSRKRFRTRVYVRWEKEMKDYTRLENGR